MDTDARPAALRGRTAFILACAVAAVVLPFTERPTPGAIREMWPPVTVFFVWTTLFFDGDEPLGRRLAMHCAAQLSIFAGLATALGTPASEAVHMGVVNVVCALVVARLFWSLNGGWDLATPHSVTLVMAVSAVSGLFVGLLGGFPDLAAFDLDAKLLMWWVIRNGVFMFVGVSTMMVVFHAQRPAWTDRDTRWWEVALLGPFSLACVWLVFEGPELPTSWVLLLPGVVSGLIFTRLGAAASTLAVSVLAAGFTMMPGNRYGYDGLIPASVVVDLLLLAMTFLALQLAVVREQRATMMGELVASRARTRSQATLLAQVLDSMNDGVIVLGREGEVAFHNPAARQLLGRRLPERVGGTTWVDHFGLAGADGSPLTDRDLVELADGHGRALLVDNPGSKRYIQAGISELETETGPASLVLFSDVTAQRQRMAELAGFARIVAHDLRTPLTSLYGRLELAREDLEDGQYADVHTHLGRAVESGHRMREVIDDWLTYSVLRDGRLAPTPLDLGPMVDDVLTGYLDDTGEDRVLAVDVHHKVVADAAMVRQLVANLVGNAVKYVAAGRPAQVHISSHADDEDGWVRIDVSDRGIGIPAGQEEAIFDEFHRAPQHCESFKGSGLGLALCRRIVHQHGGRISAASNAPDHGATISFTLPAA
ncbi:ATP-binding protein [uncultured Nocardioides sp.]|uniref:sensor histidine kinase n=1 Tax=uncultured Nocardioides sp. TaxID=198441 RepID=UPI0025F58BA3|nr:ATP-binding protein [uncultured Nocardioides sp.]